MKKMLDEAIDFAYNKNSALKLKFTTFRKYLVSNKEVYCSHENDISAENKTEKEGTWIPQENENKEWQKCFKEKKTKR